MGYLNNAATTWPKPECVVNAVRDFMLTGGANSSRGSNSQRDMKTLNIMLDCRIKLAEFFGGYDDDPMFVTFTANITESLNVVLRGYLREGMRVLTTSMEHNAVMRPLRALESKGLKIGIVQGDSRGLVKAEDIKRELDSVKYDLMVMSHASNVCGTVQPVEEAAEICRKHSVPLVLDTAQTAGVIPVNASELGLAALCFTGHKSLMGPQGTGGIIWNREFAERVEPLITGGTGSYSHLETQPDEMPDKFESGTPNLPGIAGLNSALDWLNSEGIGKISERENETGQYFLEGLKGIDGMILSGLTEMKGRLPVFSFNIEGKDNGILADGLSRLGFETRPGLHCSPSAHKTLGTFPQGTLRVSPGYFTDTGEAGEFIYALKTLL
ncbi:MAG: aminotransferase class V-fold PLP-dependent enzyme [Synergistaceae bacterium]|nr:aminotransferase class V-fold PLP-dependent enzyme [Synergistaceae bacterium]